MPSNIDIATMVNKRPICCGNDIRPWNIILTGRSIKLIDLFDPGHKGCVEDIEESKRNIVDFLLNGTRRMEFEYVEPVKHLPSLEEIITEQKSRMEMKRGAIE